MRVALITTSLLAAVTSTSALAARVIVEDTCSQTPWLETTVPSSAGKSAGYVTISALEEAGIPFLGTEGGINSINGTVTGNAALEVVSDTEMRAYGWCFSLNGVEPNKMPDKVFVSGEDDMVRWYFGFAHYRDGAWISNCTPTNQALPAYICD